MKVAIINGSPKAKDSASEKFAGQMEMLLEGRAEIVPFQWSKTAVEKDELEAVASCDGIVFVFPLYVDGIPSHLLHILQELERYFCEEGGGKQRVYTVINAGFYEGNQTHLAQEMMRHWCSRAGLVWGMGMGVGAGPMLAGLDVPLGKGPTKKLSQTFRALVQAILSGSTGEDQNTGPNFPRRMYIAAGNMGWRMEAKRNGLARGALYRRVQE